MYSGSPSLAMMRSITAAAPRSWNVSLGSVTDGGVITPAAATSALAVGLSNAIWQALATEPTYGVPSSPRTSRIAPSSPDAPWITGNTALGGSARSWASSSESASATTASMPASARASRTRWPERSDTSRSADSPPASTITRSSSYILSISLVSRD